MVLEEDWLEKVKGEEVWEEVWGGRKEGGREVLVVRGFGKE